MIIVYRLAFEGKKVLTGTKSKTGTGIQKGDSNAKDTGSG